MAVLAKDLRAAVLQAAIQGKLTKQLPEDGDARDLLAQIKAEKEQLIKDKKIKKEKPIAPIEDDEIPFDIPDNWAFCYINDIAFVTKLAGFEYSSKIAPNLSSNGIPLFKGKNVQNGSLVLNFESYIPKEISDELVRSKINKKCLLTPYVGTIGNIAIFDGTFEAHLGSNVGKIEIFNNFALHILDEYLLYYLRSKSGYFELTKYKKATAQESISIDAIRNVIVPIPPLSEQYRIVARVEELMALIDEYEKIENQLVELKEKFPGDMKAALLQAAMQGKFTKHCDSDSDAFELANSIKEYRKKLGPNKYIDDEYDDVLIPSYWDYIKVGECFALINGEKVNGVNLPLLDAKYLRQQGEATYLTKGQKVTYGQKVILVDGENSGEVFVAPCDGILGSTFKILYIPEALNEGYAMYFLWMYKQSLRNNKKGSAIPHLNKNIFNNLLFPVPPIEEQQRIVDTLDKLLPLCDELTE